MSFPSLVGASLSGHINQHCNPIEGTKGSNIRPSLHEFSGAAAETSIQVLNSRNLPSPSPGDEKSKTKVSAAWFLLTAVRTACSHASHIASGDSGNNLYSLTCKSITSVSAFIFIWVLLVSLCPDFSFL